MDLIILCWVFIDMFSFCVLRCCFYVCSVFGLLMSYVVCVVLVMWLFGSGWVVVCVVILVGLLLLR